MSPGEDERSLRDRLDARAADHVELLRLALVGQVKNGQQLRADVGVVGLHVRVFGRRRMGENLGDHLVLWGEEKMTYI